LPELSIILPAYNEAATVRRAVEAVLAIELSTEIIAVDDGSTDGTGAALQSLLEEGKLKRLIRVTRNAGKGAAIRAAIPHCTGNATVCQDADLEYDPNELPRLYRLIESGKADAVFGSRLIGGGEHRVLYFWHYVGNKIVTLASNVFTNLNLTDMETCYKMVRTPLMKSLKLRSTRFGIEPELTARLAHANARIFEVPVSYSGRTYAEGKKIGWRDGVAALWHIVFYNLVR
jgi:glycosyltransferase involved in cell wall biosynthesis